jgi:uncharacterized protein YprB with RNaseH-like and TPR domain
MAKANLVERVGELKEQGLSFTQIGNQLNMSKDQVQKFHKRYAEGKPEDLLPPQRKATPTPKFVGIDIAFFDIETTFSNWRRMLCGSIADGLGKVTTLSHDTHPGKNWQDDSVLVKAYCEELDKYDVIVGWNSKLFDVPVLNSRMLYHGFRPYDPKMHLDLMYKATGSSIAIGRKSLDNVSKYFGVQNKKTPLDPRTWDNADHGDRAAYEKIIEHCEADVLVLRDVYAKLKPMVRILHR